MFEPPINEVQTVNEPSEKKSNRKNRLKPIQPHVSIKIIIDTTIYFNYYTTKHNL